MARIATPDRAHAGLAAEIVARLRALYVERDEDWRRDHLGASLIGHDCDRHLWLTFRWAVAPNHDGKQLRLFERGEREERWIIDDLRAAGFALEQVDPFTGQQRRIVLGSTGHAGGGMDLRFLGLIDGKPVLGEIKTHNEKSFDRLVEKGVKASKPEHYAQMQSYMGGDGMLFAVYIAVCKNDDRIHVEIVPFDASFYARIAEKADRIVRATEPPPREIDKAHPPCLYTSQDGRTWPCQHYQLCHGQAMPERNCRTCAYSTPENGGTWRCVRFNEALSGEKQREGCASWVVIPSIVNAQVVDATEDWVELQFADGRKVTVP